MSDGTGPDDHDAPGTGAGAGTPGTGAGTGAGTSRAGAGARPPVPPPPPPYPPAGPYTSAYPPPCPPAPPALPVRRRRRGLALGLAALLVGLAAAGGAGYAVLGGGDSGKGAKNGAGSGHGAGKGWGARSGGTHYGSLGRMLLPMPYDFTPGPDVKTYGNDTVLDAGRTLRLLRSDETARTPEQRRTLDSLITSARFEGAALRTYASVSNGMVVTMRLLQMGNQFVARGYAMGPAFLAREGGDYSPGPTVRGYPQASCALWWLDQGHALEGMTCAADEGDVVVTMKVTGTAPLEKTRAAELMAKQLDRVKVPGEAV